MGHTICLLTATLFAGQTGDVKVSRQTKIIVPQQTSRVQQQPIQQRGTFSTIRHWWERNRPNLIQRIQHRVNSRSAQKPRTRKYTPHQTQYRPTKKIVMPNSNRPKTNEPPLADSRKTVVNYRPTAKKADVPLPGLRLSPKIENSVGAGEKHTWITGQLRRHGRVWVLIYAPEEVVDPYNGRLVLNSKIDMSKFHDGDVVHVRGRVQGRHSNGIHVYRLNSIDRIPDAK